MAQQPQKKITELTDREIIEKTLFNTRMAAESSKWVKQYIIVGSIIAVILFIISIATRAQAQQVNDARYIYCTIVGTTKMMSNKVTVEIDFGQAKSYWSRDRLKDETGNPIVFNSMVDALNYMSEKGWEFVQAYTVTVGGQNVYHYLMKMPQEKKL
jgi:hypothetical protein